MMDGEEVKAAVVGVGKVRVVCCLKPQDDFFGVRGQRAWGKPQPSLFAFK